MAADICFSEPTNRGKNVNFFVYKQTLPPILKSFLIFSFTFSNIKPNEFTQLL